MPPRVRETGGGQIGPARNRGWKEMVAGSSSGGHGDVITLKVDRSLSGGLVAAR